MDFSSNFYKWNFLLLDSFGLNYQHNTGLTGLMSLFNEAIKSSRLTSSFSAVSMFTSTVLLAWNTNTQKKLKLYIYIIYIYVFVFTYMPKFPAMIAHLNHRSCQKTMFPLRDKRSQEEAGGRRRAEEKRQSWEMCVRPLSVIYHHPTISAALWVPLTVCGNLTLSACPALFLQY